LAGLRLIAFSYNQRKLMAWPLSQDYNEAIQSPATSFSDPELKQTVARAVSVNSSNRHRHG
jgi:hypothetical protein